MKGQACLLVAILSAGLSAPCTAAYRIAYSSDGNKHDADDWHASVLALAMIAKAGLTDQLVHFDYNNHLGDNEDWRAATHHQVISEAIDRYGYDASRFFDDQRDLSGAIASIARAINASSADDRLYLICAGPMEVCWRGIDAAADDKEPFVTVVSHGRWNESHADTDQLKHTLAHIKRDFAVQVDQLLTQNAAAFRSDPADWTWLLDEDHGSWLHRAVAEGRKAGDASDAGMVYYVITGRRRAGARATMEDIRAFFQRPADALAPQESGQASR